MKFETFLNSVQWGLTRLSDDSRYPTWLIERYKNKLSQDSDMVKSLLDWVPSIARVCLVQSELLLYTQCRRIHKFSSLLQWGTFSDDKMNAFVRESDQQLKAAQHVLIWITSHAVRCRWDFSWIIWPVCNSLWIILWDHIMRNYDPQKQLNPRLWNFINHGNKEYLHLLGGTSPCGKIPPPFFQDELKDFMYPSLN